MIAIAEKGHVTGPAQGPYIRATHSMDSGMGITFRFADGRATAMELDRLEYVSK